MISQSNFLSFRCFLSECALCALLPQVQRQVRNHQRFSVGQAQGRRKMVRSQRGLGAGSAAARHDDAHVSCLQVAPGRSEAYGFPLRGESCCLCSITPPALNTTLYTRSQLHALCSCLLRDHRLKLRERLQLISPSAAVAGS